jgi:hypothetical protein
MGMALSISHLIIMVAHDGCLWLATRRRLGVNNRFKPTPRETVA